MIEGASQSTSDIRAKQLKLFILKKKRKEKKILAV
jgi:hypothetical protein